MRNVSGSWEQASKSEAPRHQKLRKASGNSEWSGHIISICGISTPTSFRQNTGPADYQR